MFGEAEFKLALKAYNAETKSRGSDEFTALRRNNTFFTDIKSKEAVKQQAQEFVNLISNLNRDEYSQRFVVEVFLLEFCRYLDKDFLFAITDGKTFFEMRDKLKSFTGKIYESNKKFTQNAGLYTLTHLLEDYGNLLSYLQEHDVVKESPASIFGSFWG